MIITDRSKALYDELATGWNTWDSQSVTAHVFLPERFRVNVAFFMPHSNRHVTNCLWREVHRFGEHTVDGSYTEIDIVYCDGIYHVESAAQGREFCLRITPIQKRYNMYAALEIGQVFSRCGIFSCTDKGVFAEIGGQTFDVRTLTPVEPPAWDPFTMPHIIVKLDETAYFTVNSSKSRAEIDGMLAERRSQWMGECISAGGKLGQGLEALRRCLLWNKFYDFVNDRVVTPVSRNWCRRTSMNYFGDYVNFGWDSFFGGLQYGLIDKRLAYATVFNLLEEATENGMIPNAGCGGGITRDRSEPQVGSLCVWKLYIQFGDLWFVQECFDRLLAWNEWRFSHRDYNHDGLLELGTDPWDSGEIEEVLNKEECGNKLSAMFESGLDNSTMWDRAVFNEQLHCMELSYVGINSTMVMDCQLLAKMAKLLGRTKECEELNRRAEKLAGLINAELWDESTGCYLNKHWNGNFDPCLSLTHFYTMLGGVATGERLDRLFGEHLLNPDEFWGKYVIPNISRNDPTFIDQEYWRGRIWAPTNFLVGEGVLRTGRLDVWDELVEKGLDMFIECWNEKGAVGENYNAITGQAAERSSSDKFYHWGALLAYMAVQRICCFNEWKDAVEYLPRPAWFDSLKNLPLANSKTDIE